MVAPVIAICGIATDEASWLDMPVDHVVVPRGATVAAMAAAILARLPDRFALCGHSMGGYVALEIAARAAGRLTGFAMLSSACTADSEEAKAARRGAIAAARADFPALAARLGRAMLSRPSRSDLALLGDVEAMLLRCGAERFAEQQTAATMRADHSDVIAAIGVPTLILTGEEDGIVAPARSREMAALLPAAAFRIIADCGHVPQREAPAATRAAISAWREGMAP